MPDMLIEPMAARVEQVTSAGTYVGATATGLAGVAGWLDWLGANQSGLTTLVMLVTGFVTVASALYGMYHRHRIREIAATQGFEALRRSDQ